MTIFCAFRRGYERNSVCAIVRMYMDEIDILLTRGVDSIYPSREELEKVLRSGKKLRLYQGFDPTGTQLHIGHAVALRKLRQWQDLGHEVIFLIGDFTALIGDPTGKLSARKMLTKEEVKKNAEHYKIQAEKILRFDGLNAVTVKYNSDWLEKVSALEFLELAHHLTYQQVVERDMFQQRIKQGQDVFMNEFLYPILQAYDSVAMDVDLEIGGTDQMFNMMMGRKLMRNIKKREKFVMTVPLLTDSKGVKIGKTEGNVIGLTDAPNEFYGKIMALGDDAIVPCFTLLTDIPLADIDAIKKRMKTENPMTFKKQLAFELTKQFNDETAAKIAQQEFETRFQEKKVNEADLKVVPQSVIPSNATIIEALLAVGLTKSKREGRQKIQEKGVRINGILVTVPSEILKVNEGTILELGRKAVRIGK